MNVFQTDMKSIYDLELHETLYSPMCWGLRTDVTRVPGGWIYQSTYRKKFNNGDGEDECLSPVFVPYNEEFRP